MPSTFDIVGGRDGIARLVTAFYDYMDSLPEAAGVRAMHPASLADARDKLTAFLCSWLGGPNEYRERFGPISIPQAHSRFAIAAAERDAWLLCMQHAVDDQAWPADMKLQFMHAIAIPAERVRMTS